VATGGAGAGTGKVEAAPIQVLKDFDQCSPQIFLDVVTGKHVKEVTITLSDVTISSVEGTTTARNGTEDVRNIQESAATEVNTGDPTAVQEIVAFTFRKIQLTDLTTNKTVSFDFAENRI
jgi:type VI protein secretion system component Hcp